MSFKKFVVVIGSILLLAVASTATWARTVDATVTVTVTPGTSTPGGISPCYTPNCNVIGNPDTTQAFYVYSFAQGSMSSDTIPIVITSTSVDGQVITTGPGGGTTYFNAYCGSDSSTPVGVTLQWSPGNGGAGNLPATSFALPAFSTPTVTDGNNSCSVPSTSPAAHTVYVSLSNLNNLSPGTYNLNYAISVDTEPTDTNASVDGQYHFHVQINVTNPTSAVGCFITDSNFNFLLDADGNPVTSGSTGVFAIVANHRNIEVSTNPGQFYYNILWTNSTNSDQTVNAVFGLTNADAQGAQAIHAGVFPPPFSGVSFDSFNTVNESIPGGSGTTISGIQVPSGWTLWVDYHFDWAGIGEPVPPGIGTTPGTANQLFSVIGSLSDGTGGIGSCTAGASGYLK